MLSFALRPSRPLLPATVAPRRLSEKQVPSARGASLQRRLRSLLGAPAPIASKRSGGLVEGQDGRLRASWHREQNRRRRRQRQQLLGARGGEGEGLFRVKDGGDSVHSWLPLVASGQWGSNVAAVTIHGRSKQQRYSKDSDWGERRGKKGGCFYYCSQPRRPRFSLFFSSSLSHISTPLSFLSYPL